MKFSANPCAAQRLYVSVEVNGLASAKEQWKTKNMSKKPFKRESKVDDIPANIKEGENISQKTQHSKAYTFDFANYNYKVVSFLSRL